MNMASPGTGDLRLPRYQTLKYKNGKPSRRELNRKVLLPVIIQYHIRSMKILLLLCVFLAFSHDKVPIRRHT